jgi:peptidylamidoglycolate lyase
MNAAIFAIIVGCLLGGCRNPASSPLTDKRDSNGSKSFTLVADWPKIPVGIQLGQVMGVAVNSKNQVIVFHRADRTWAEPFPKEKIKDQTIAVFNGESGKLIKTFGAKRFIMPHGLSVDLEDNIWVTDVGSHQIHKLSSEDGSVLLSIGEQGVPGNDRNHFARPTDVSFSNDGGFYVSDGYINTRVVKFSSTGQFEFQWGMPGARPRQFNLPHGIAVDALRVYVADRSNKRLQIFNHDGSFLKEWKGDHIGRPFGVATDSTDHVIVIDGGDQPDNTRSRIIIFSKNGKVIDSFDAAQESDAKNLGHDIAVGRDGAVYVADAWANSIRKFVKRTETVDQSQ